jgi:hypothetical protein
MNQSWSEAAATWSNTVPTSNQGVLIGSFTPTATGNHTITLNSAGRGLVQDWINGSSSNNGIMILDRATSDGIDVRSSEYSTANVRPKLTITYQ